MEAPEKNLEAPEKNLEAPQQILEVIFLFLFDWIACEAAAQFLEYLAVYLAEHHGAVYLTVAQAGQLLEGAAALLIVVGEHAEGHQHLVGVQAWVPGAQVFCLRLLNGLDEALRDELGLMVDACQVLGDIEQQCG